MKLKKQEKKLKIIINKVKVLSNYLMILEI